ncbi:MAG: DsbA family oxidoreductase [Rhodospirillales bacterium]
MLVEVYADAVCPWCYIGKRRLERARAMRPEATIDLVWKPFQLNPWMPTEGMNRDAYLTAKFGASDAGRIYDNIRQSGLADDIEFNFDQITRTPNTLNAHRLIAWSRRIGGGDHQNAVVQALFEAYFQKGEDIGETSILTEIAAIVGLDPTAARIYLNSDEDLEAIRAEDTKARQLGVQGVPCFVVDKRFAVSGAQEPEYFMPLFDLALADLSAK